jgi:hypothetical protein
MASPTGRFVGLAVKEKRGTGERDWRADVLSLPQHEKHATGQDRKETFLTMRRQFMSDSEDEEKMWEVVASPAPPRDPHAAPSYNYSYMAEDGQLGVRDSAKHQPNFRFSQPRGSDTGRPSTAGTPTEGGGDVFVRGTLGGRDIEALKMDLAGPGKTTMSYKGRYRMWPGLLLFLLLLGGAAALATFKAIQAHSDSRERDAAYERTLFKATMIEDDTGTKKNSSVTGKDIVSDDGAIGNPKVYPPSACELPNYLSKNGHIVAVAANGTEVPLKIKGINWFGMETYVMLWCLNGGRTCRI